MLGMLLLGFAGSTMAIEPAELDNRIQTLAMKFEAMQQKPDKKIPAETLAKACGIVLLDRTKAGFVFAFQGGNGVAMVKDANDKWSAPAFLTANEASLGFQIGGEQALYVILLMNTNATRMLTDPNYEFGGEARGTAGDNTAGAEGKVTPEPPVLVFDDRRGLYGGAAIKGGAIAPDNTANRVYYGESLTMQNILFDNKAKPSESAQALAKKITRHSTPPTAAKNGN